MEIRFDDALTTSSPRRKDVAERVGGNDEKVETIISRSGARVALGATVTLTRRDAGINIKKS